MLKPHSFHRTPTSLGTVPRLSLGRLCPCAPDLLHHLSAEHLTGMSAWSPKLTSSDPNLVGPRPPPQPSPLPVNPTYPAGLAGPCSRPREPPPVASGTHSQPPAPPSSSDGQGYSGYSPACGPLYQDTFLNWTSPRCLSVFSRPGTQSLPYSCLAMFLFVTGLSSNWISH